MMAELKQVECKYCGGILELRKMIRLNEEGEYACQACASKMGLG